MLLSGIILAAQFAAFGPAFAGSGDYQVLERAHQSAAVNREEADITVIRCNGKKYYIYSYYRDAGPQYRAIIPPYWGNPLGGKDFYTYDDVISVACTQ